MREVSVLTTDKYRNESVIHVPKARSRYLCKLLVSRADNRKFTFTVKSFCYLATT